MTELSEEENSWIFIDENSSSGSLIDSDNIDSETEAELYSKIHHEPNLYSIDSENLTEKPSELLVFTPFTENASTPIENTREHLFSTQNSSNAKRKSSEMKSDEKLSPTKKHKLNAVYQSVNLKSEDIENINDSQQFTANNLQNTSRTFNLQVDKKYNNRNSTVILDSSDSDNDIWTEPHSNVKNDLKINLLKDSDTIFFSSSDSENESNISSPYMRRDSILKNLSMPNIQADRNLKDLWHINYEDLNRSKKYSNRYHENLDITCSNCNKKGHTYRTCPSPKVIKCFVCGGNHIGVRCSKRMCSNCHMSGHDRKNCWREVYRGLCHICNMKGHAKGNCPDLWRRYHLSTTPKKLSKGKPIVQDVNLYCWNCGKKGHFGAVCPASHPSRTPFKTWPCVISYTNPKYILKSRSFYYSKISSSNAEKINKNFCYDPNASSEIKYNQQNLNTEIKYNQQNLNTEIKYNQQNFNNNLSVSNDRNRRKKVKKKKMKNPDLNKAQGVVKERNFPRTPKNENSINCFFSPPLSEEVEKSPSSSVKKHFLKLKQRFNEQVKKSGLQSQEVMNQDFASKMLKSPVKSEHEIPKVIQKIVRKKFNRWRRQRIIFLNQRQNVA